VVDLIEGAAWPLDGLAEIAGSDLAGAIPWELSKFIVFHWSNLVFVRFGFRGSESARSP